MAPRGGSAAPPYWTEWEWNEERQMLRRALIDYKGRVLRQQFGERQQNPRYPSAANTLPQRPDDAEQQALTGNYTFGSAGATESPPQDGVGQREEINSAYSSPSLTNASSGLENSGSLYADPSALQVSQSRFGFPTAQTIHSGFGAQYGSSNPQIAHLGLQAQYGMQQSHYEAPGRPVALHQYNTQSPGGSSVQRGYPDQFSSAAGPMPPPASSYQQESTWSKSNLQMGSAGSLNERSAQPGFSGPYIASPSNIASSGPAVDLELGFQESYSETPSTSAENEIPEFRPAHTSSRTRSVYPGSYTGKVVHSHIAHSESETTDAYTDDSTIGVRIEIAKNDPLPGEAGYAQKTSYKSSSRASKTGGGRSVSYNSEVTELTQNMQDSSLASPPLERHTNPSTSPSEDVKELQKPSTRIPPVGYQKPDSDEDVSLPGDMTRTTKSRSRRQSDAHRHHRHRDSRQPMEQSTKSIVKEPGNNNRNTLDSRFQIHKSKEFTKGRVLITLWSEPIGGGGGGGATYEAEMEGIKPSKYGESAYHSVRRFVIVKTHEGHSNCVAILTYGGQGTAKPGVKYKDHAIIYTGSKVPDKLKGEKTLLKKPLRMENDTDQDTLVKASRLNYTKTYTVEHNLKVRFIGKIHKDSEHVFFTEAKRMFDEEKDLEAETGEQTYT